jgi:DNA (cytosine-5)-methyltransferase 1
LGELGYGFAYRVLDAQYFGLAQRRARVFVVGHLGDWRRAAAVLFERESLSGHPAPRSEAGQRVAGTVTGGASSGGHGRFASSDAAAQNLLVPSIGDLSHCLNAGGMGRIDYETETLIAHSLRTDGFDASEDGTGRGTPLIAQAFTENQRGELVTSDTMGALNVGGGKPGHGYPAVAFDARQSDVIQYGEKSGPLDTDGHSIAVAFSTSSLDSPRDDGSTPPLKANLNGQGTGAGPSVFAAVGMQVRRLTPRECERLQGFPDDYTLIPYRGKPAADGPRYKALGNSMAVPVMRWIGERIQMVESLDLHEKAS